MFKVIKAKSSWRLRSNHIIIKVMDYVIWDFKGPIGRKTYSLLATRSCLVIIIIIFFLTRFLRNAWTDFPEIFRDGVCWSSLAETNFSSHDVTSGRRYWRFSDFEVVILCTKDLQNYSRYLLQIFTEDRRRTEVYPYWVSSL